MAHSEIDSGIFCSLFCCIHESGSSVLFVRTSYTQICVGFSLNVPLMTKKRSSQCDPVAREGAAALPYTEIAESGINVFIENRSSVGVCYQNPTSRISIAHRDQNLGVGAG